MQVVERVLTLLGQAVELALTGRSEFRLTTSPFEKSPVITDTVQARMVLQEVQREVAIGFGIRLLDPVLLDLEELPPWGWKSVLSSAGRQLGRYAPRHMGRSRVHRIVVVPGLERPRFRGVVAHELVHAWQAERGILRKSRGLREGMARWVEYHVLRSAGREDLAKRLLKIKRYSLGRHLEHLLEREAREGRPPVLRWLETVDD